MTGSFACTMSFYNTGARYLFALGREGVLPGRSPAPPTPQPGDASMTVTVIVAIYCLGVRALRPEHRGRPAQAGHLVAAAGRAGHPGRSGAGVDRHHPLLPDHGRADFHWWTTLVAPCSGSRRWSSPARCSWSTEATSPARPTRVYIQVLPWVVLGVFVLGLAPPGPAQHGPRQLRPHRPVRIGQTSPQTERPQEHRHDRRRRSGRRDRLPSAEPLTRRGGRRRRATLLRERKPRAPTAAVRLRHAARAAEVRRPGWTAGRRSAAPRGTHRALRTRRPDDLRGRRLAHRARGSVVARASRASRRRSWPRSSWPASDRPGDPRWQEAMRRRGSPTSPWP